MYIYKDYTIKNPSYRNTLKLKLGLSIEEKDFRVTLSHAESDQMTVMQPMNAIW
jgi:hypothetical protein